MSDLSLVQHGWLHLLEHLALHGDDLVRRPVNGHVDLLYTGFDVHGSPEDVVEFLANLSAWLRTPGFTDVDHECRVLRAEGLQRPGAVVARHLLWRYGARGPGIVAFDELGLYTAEPELLRLLADAAFGKGNAALSLSAPPPPGLVLPLADGPPLPCPQPRALAQPYPAAFPDPVDGIALSGTVARSVGATLLRWLIERALHRQIRENAGTGYGAHSVYEPVSGDTAVLVAGIDVLPEARDGLVEQAWAIVDGLAEHGPDPQELREHTARAITDLQQTPAETWLPWAAARDALLGRPTQDGEQLIAELAAVTPDDVRAAAVQLRDSLLIGGRADEQTVDEQPVAHTEAITWLDPVPPRPMTVAGQRYRSVDAPISDSTLCVSDVHAEMTRGRLTVTVSADDIAAAVGYPDGGRLLVRGDGCRLPVEPTLWHNGRDAVERVDRLVDPAVRVAMPARAPDEVPKPVTKPAERMLYRVLSPPRVLDALAPGLFMLIFLASSAAVSLASKWLIIAWGALRAGALVHDRHERKGPPHVKRWLLLAAVWLVALGAVIELYPDESDHLSRPTASVVNAADRCSPPPPADASPAGLAYLRAVADAAPGWQAVDASIAAAGDVVHRTDLRVQLSTDAVFLDRLRSITFPEEVHATAARLIFAVEAYDQFLQTAYERPGYLAEHTAEDKTLNDSLSHAAASLRSALGLPPPPCTFRRP